jgi:hypothetical protein
MGLLDKFKKKIRPSQTLDFSTIDSNEKALKLYNENRLAKLHLIALDFGGDDGPSNILFVPVAAVQQKTKLDKELMHMLEAGLKIGFNASPEYKGKSFIPSKIIIKITGDINRTEIIEIW